LSTAPRQAGGSTLHEAKLKQLEEELPVRHREIKEALEHQRANLGNKKRPLTPKGKSMMSTPEF
jgi:hypothetical protein